MIKNVGYTACYQADMRSLFALLLGREKNVVEVHKLLAAMHNCIHYRRVFHQSTTLESGNLAKESAINADDELRELMNAWCLLEGDKQLIWSLVYRSV